MKIALLGTGIMGAPMARNLAQAGHEVTVWNRSIEKSAPLRDAGIVVAGTPTEAVRTVECALLMLNTGPTCDQILFGKESTPGIADALRRDSVVLVMSSIPVATARAQAERLRGWSVHYVDAPVSGGERGAIAGKLSIMAGGDRAIIERLHPVFSPLGRVTHLGPVGTGQLAKLANQLIVGVTIGAVAEAMLLARAGGADLVAVRAALRGGFADSTVLEQHGERMITGDFRPGARADVQLKDLRTALDQARASGCQLPFLTLAEELYDRMCRGERAALDHSALYLELIEHGTRA